MSKPDKRGKEGTCKICLVYNTYKDIAFVFSNQKQALTCISAERPAMVWEWHELWNTPVSVETLRKDETETPWVLLERAHKQGNWVTKIPYPFEAVKNEIETRCKHHPAG